MYKEIGISIPRLSVVQNHHSESRTLSIFQAGQSNWPGQLPAVAVPSPSSGSPAWPLSIRSLSQQARRRHRSQSCRRGPFAPEARLSRPESRLPVTHPVSRPWPALRPPARARPTTAFRSEPDWSSGRGEGGGGASERARLREATLFQTLERRRASGRARAPGGAVSFVRLQLRAALSSPPHLHSIGRAGVLRADD